MGNGKNLQYWQQIIYIQECNIIELWTIQYICAILATDTQSNEYNNYWANYVADICNTDRYKNSCNIKYGLYSGNLQYWQQIHKGM